MHSSQKGQQVGSRAFRCGYEGCGRLYTTAHHLKVKQVTCGHAEQPYPHILVPDQNTAIQKAECVLGSPGDPGLFIVQQRTSDSLYQLGFSTLFSSLLVFDFSLETCSFFSRYMNVLTQVTGHICVTSPAAAKHLLQVTISLLSKFCFLSSPNHS